MFTIWGPTIVLPPKFLHEVKDKPELSLTLFLEKVIVCFGRDSGSITYRNLYRSHFRATWASSRTKIRMRMNIR